MDKAREWTSVEDELPETGVHVLGFLYTGDIEVVRRLDEYKSLPGWVTSEWLRCHVSHWMPLPAPPTE